MIWLLLTKEKVKYDFKKSRIKTHSVLIRFVLGIGSFADFVDMIIHPWSAKFDVRCDIPYDFFNFFMKYRYMYTYNYTHH